MNIRLHPIGAQTGRPLSTDRRFHRVQWGVLSKIIDFSIDSRRANDYRGTGLFRAFMPAY